MTPGKPPTPAKAPVPAPRALTPHEAWYLESFRTWAKHYKRAPSIRELAGYLSRSHTPVGMALESLWRKGHLIRHRSGGTKARYSLPPGAAS